MTSVPDYRLDDPYSRVPGRPLYSRVSPVFWSDCSWTSTRRTEPHNRPEQEKGNRLRIIWRENREQTGRFPLSLPFLSWTSFSLPFCFLLPPVLPNPRF
jgi:hypothetical protein